MRGPRCDSRSLRRSTFIRVFASSIALPSFALASAVGNASSRVSSVFARSSDTAVNDPIPSGIGSSFDRSKVGWSNSASRPLRGFGAFSRAIVVSDSFSNPQRKSRRSMPASDTFRSDDSTTPVALPGRISRKRTPSGSKPPPALASSVRSGCSTALLRWPSSTEATTASPPASHITRSLPSVHHDHAGAFALAAGTLTMLRLPFFASTGLDVPINVPTSRLNGAMTSRPAAPRITTTTKGVAGLPASPGTLPEATTNPCLAMCLITATASAPESFLLGTCASIFSKSGVAVASSISPRVVSLSIL